MNEEQYNREEHLARARASAKEYQDAATAIEQGAEIWVDETGNIETAEKHHTRVELIAKLIAKHKRGMADTLNRLDPYAP